MQREPQIQESEDTGPSESLVVRAPLRPSAVIERNDNFTSMNCLSISGEWIARMIPFLALGPFKLTKRSQTDKFTSYNSFGTRDQGRKWINYSTSMFFRPDMNGQLSWWSLKDFSSLGSDRQDLYGRHKRCNSQILKSSWVWLLELVHKCRFSILVLSLCQNIVFRK